MLPDDTYIEWAPTDSIDSLTPTWVKLNLPIRDLVFSRGVVRSANRWEPGTLELLMGDANREFDPANRESTLYPNVEARRLLRVMVNHDGRLRQMWKGYITNIRPGFSVSDSWVEIEAVESHNQAQREMPPSVLWQTIEDLDPWWWWPLSESGGLVAYNRGRNQLDAGYFATGFSDPPIAPWTTETSVHFEKAGSSYALAAGGNINVPMPCTVMCWTRGVGAGVSSNNVALSTGQVGILAVGDLGLYVGSTEARFAVSDGTTVSQFIGVPGLDTNSPHLVVGRYDPAGSLRINVDPGTSYAASNSVAAMGQRPRDGYVVVGNALSTNLPHTNSLAHVAVWDRLLSDAELASLGVAGWLPWYGDRTDARIGRVLDIMGVDPSDRALDAGSEYMFASAFNREPAIDVMTRAANTERGLLFKSKDGVWTFHNREHAGAYRGTFDATGRDRVTDVERIDERANFEIDIDSAFWVPLNASFARTTSSPLVGNSSALLTTSSAGTVDLHTDIPVLLGDLVSCGALISLGGGSGTATAELAWLDDLGATISTTSKSYPLTTPAFVEVAGSAPSGARTCRVKVVKLTGSTTGNQTRVDHVWLTSPRAGFGNLRDYELTMDERTFTTRAVTHIELPGEDREVVFESENIARYGQVTVDRPTSYYSAQAALAAAQAIVGEGKPRTTVIDAGTRGGTSGTAWDDVLDLELNDQIRVLIRYPVTNSANTLRWATGEPFWSSSAGWGKQQVAIHDGRVIWLEHHLDGRELTWDVSRTLALPTTPPRFLLPEFDTLSPADVPGMENSLLLFDPSTEHGADGTTIVGTGPIPHTPTLGVNIQNPPFTSGRPDWDDDVPAGIWSAYWDASFESMAQRSGGVVSQYDTIVMVARHSASDIGNNRYFLDGRPEGTAGRRLVNSNSGAWRMFAGVNLQGGTANANTHFFLAEFNGANSKLWVDGGSPIASGDAGSDTVDGFTIGAGRTGASAQFLGIGAHIYYIAHIPRLLSLSEKERVRSWLQNVHPSGTDFTSAPMKAT